MSLSRLWIQRLPRVLCMSVRITHSDISGRDFFTKNEQLKRPMSPHLTIYRPQLTSMMSIGHRITGVFLIGEISTLSVTYLVTGRQVNELIYTIQSFGVHPALITLNKFIIAYAFTYHAFNGIRHLAWDTGRGFHLPTLYKSGYAVLILSLLSALGLALYRPY